MFSVPWVQVTTAVTLMCRSVQVLLFTCVPCDPDLSLIRKWCPDEFQLSAKIPSQQFLTATQCPRMWSWLRLQVWSWSCPPSWRMCHQMLWMTSYGWLHILQLGGQLQDHTWRRSQDHIRGHWVAVKNCWLGIFADNWNSSGHHLRINERSGSQGTHVNNNTCTERHINVTAVVTWTHGTENICETRVRTLRILEGFATQEA
jgi:hypothetical protein